MISRVVRRLTDSGGTSLWPADGGKMAAQATEEGQ